jgi:hypothetical protein
LIIRFNKKKSLEVVIKYKIFDTSEEFEEWQSIDSDPMCGQIVIKDIVPIPVAGTIKLFVTYFMN